MIALKQKRMYLTHSILRSSCAIPVPWVFTTISRAHRVMRFFHFSISGSLLRVFEGVAVRSYGCEVFD